MDADNSADLEFRPDMQQDELSEELQLQQQPQQQQLQQLQQQLLLQDTKEEPDTCRICRGDASEQEPLFHPCKCSGSIMFVHQECLMQWLQHSQKKHCELCKTSFTFTKLYHPHMPKTLPLTVFLKRASYHILTTFLFWCRALLVVSTWLLWLPWSMRFIWWGLFWIADGIWPDNANPIMSLSLTANWQPLQGQPSLPTPAPPPLTPANRVPELFSSLFFPKLSASLNTTHPFQQYPDHPQIPIRRGTLLSDIPFFNTLTPNRLINNFITDVLEGQIITLSVVAAFILVFLIREWVVQQQPAINIAAMHIPDPQSEQPEVDQDQDPTTVFWERMAMDTDDYLTSDEQLQTLDDNIKRDLAAKRDSITHSSTLLHRVRNTQMAFEIIYKDLIELDGPEKLETINNRYDRFGRLLDYLPSLESKQLKERMSATLATIDIPLMKQRYNERRHHRALMLKSVAAEHELETPNFDSASDDGHSQTPPRPTMPEREESSLATNIQRDLQEHVANADQDSDGSWQHVPVRNAYTNHSQVINYRDTLPDIGSNSQNAPIDQNTNKFDYNIAQAITNAENDEHSSVLLDSRPDQYQVTHQDDTNQDASAAEFNEHDLITGMAPITDFDQYHSITDAPDFSSRLDESISDTAANRINGEEPGQEHFTENGSTQNIAIEPHEQNPGIVDTITELIWGGIQDIQQDRQDQNIEHGLDDVAADAPFVPFANGRPQNPEDHEPEVDANQGPEDIAAAIQPDIDPNEAEAAIDDIEDLDGLMELIGMNGPMLGLFQNAIFTSVVISATIASAVWLPFLLGKLVVLSLAHPWSVMAFPLEVISVFTNLIIDIGIVFGGKILFRQLPPIHSHMPSWFGKWSWVDSLRSLRHRLLGNRVAELTDSSVDAALKRLAVFSSYPEQTLLNPSGLRFDSLAALRLVRHQFSITSTSFLEVVKHSFLALIGFDWTISNLSYAFASTLKTANHFASHGFETAVSTFKLLPKMCNFQNGLTFSLDSAHSVSIDMEPTYWTASDRTLTVLAGYMFLALAGAVYLKQVSPCATSSQGKKLERTAMEILQQAGGIMKVIMIISIEMLMFPLYCGTLLDIATLPLFGDASFQSRLDFSIKSPWTSVFVHWFIGTCYMFHFALFVSMCRKILRTGVLYFIRDPDDPTFHPVRDVLERSVSSQLRKIGFSALIYGGLVIVCMGSIVWTIALGFSGILPVRWSSSKSMLAFPVDLVLYTLFKPIALRFLMPSTGFHDLYKWWFQKCARRLRLSQFLLETQHDDEDYLKQNMFPPFKGGKYHPRLHELKSGRFVRVPSSDQVRIPRGSTVFLQVDAEDNRLDGKLENEGVHGRSKQHFTTLYIPSNFRVRIGIFVVCLWALTAVAGLCMTIVPLLLGRTFFALALPKHIWVNDVYALSLGMGTFAATAYLATNYRNWLEQSRSRFMENVNMGAQQLNSIKRSVVSLVMQSLRVLYTYSAFALLMPSLLALLIEFYVVGPLHAFITGGRQLHIVHFLQDWTLGIQYLRMTMRILNWYAETRPARALQAVIQDGYLNPNVGIATRCFIAPSLVFVLAAILIPGPIGWMVGGILYGSSDPVARIQVQRFTYPALLAVCLVIWIGYTIFKAVGKWRLRIRDEVYLIGERLHNFGERTPPSHSTHSATRLQTTSRLEVTG